MKISMRTFSDSGNQFLHAIWKSFDPFQSLLACYPLSLGTLNLNLSLLCLHFSTSDITLHPVVRLHQESFAGAHADIRPRLHAHGDNVKSAVALIGCRVITEDVLLRQVGGDLRERVVEFAHGFRNVRGAAGL